MTATHADQLIEGYLARLHAAAAELTPGARNELLDDVRVHIAEARAREPEESDSAILNILDRLGEPAVVVTEARERLGVRQTPPYRPGLLEIAAIVLLPFIWPVGVILLWISPAWKTRDKVIGTLLPPGGYPGVGILLAGATTVHSCGTLTDATGRVIQSTCTPGPPAWQVALGVLATVVIFALPLITAGYLAIQLRWGRRPEPILA